MKRATSLRNGSGRRQSRETYVGGAFLLVLAVMGLIALSRIPHGPANAPDPHSDLSSAHSSQHDKRELTQLERGSAGISLSSSAILEDNAKRLAANLSKSKGIQLESTSSQSSGKSQSADQVVRLDRAVARNQLRTKAKAVSRLTQATEYPLVIFTLLESDDLENEANLRYYVREGIREDDGCTHIIIVDPDKDLRSLPALQVENAKYVKAKEKDCLFGAMGALLRSSEVDISKFTSFIFLTSAVRGPFLPPHVKNVGVFWQQLLTSKLNNNTKLVGPMITCQDISWPSKVAEKNRHHAQPHFTPDMFATDKVGLDLLLKSGAVFQCHDLDTPNPEHFSAVTAASVILQQGYNLDCLMERYQGVRWTEIETWGCNAGLKANEGDNYYDGISIHPMEVMFVDVTGMMLRKGLSMAKAAKKYDKWKQAQAELKEDVTFNMYAFDPAIFRSARIAYMEKRGPGCFDFNYYLDSNAVLPIDGSSLVDVWKHFVESGQFEDRQYRFNCLDILARSFNCFDSNYYNRANEDLNQLRLEGRPLTPQQAWNHFLEFGYFESRKYRFMEECEDDLDSPNNLGEGL